MEDWTLEFQIWFHFDVEVLTTPKDKSKRKEEMGARHLESSSYYIDIQ